MELQGDAAVERPRPRIGEVDHQHSIQPGNVTITFDLQQVLVPFTATHHDLILRCGPHNPLSSIAIDAARMSTERAVYFKLQALADVRSAGLELGVEKDAAVPVTIALE